MINSRRKGKDGENELASKLREFGLVISKDEITTIKKIKIDMR